MRISFHIFSSASDVENKHFPSQRLEGFRVLIKVFHRRDLQAGDWWLKTNNKTK